MKIDTCLELPVDRQLALNGQATRTQICGITAREPVDASSLFVFYPQTRE